MLSRIVMKVRSSAKGDIRLKIAYGCCACETGHGAAERLRTAVVHRCDRVLSTADVRGAAKLGLSARTRARKL